MRRLLTFVLIVAGAFIGLVAWVYSRRRKPHFDEMAQMPFREGPPQNKGANSDE